MKRLALLLFLASCSATSDTPLEFGKTHNAGIKNTVKVNKSDSIYIIVNFTTYIITSDTVYLIDK